LADQFAQLTVTWFY